MFRKYLSRKFNIDTSKPIVLCVSVIWKRKGVDVFHEVARQLPDYNFVWVGSYNFAPKVKKELDDLLNLTFTGYVPDVVAAYCGADVFFFPSRAENQGIPLLEAAACRLPIVCRGLPTYDWMNHGVDCLKARHDATFKELITKVIDDKALREMLVQNAFDNVQEHDSEKIMDKVESIYRQAIILKKRDDMAKLKQKTNG
jgi:1,2-diacylglycerol-3-alpha-glucose alpha-1,2-glucosyltransferase